jgi:hypothetical protein
VTVATSGLTIKFGKIQHTDKFMKQYRPTTSIFPMQQTYDGAGSGTVSCSEVRGSVVRRSEECVGLL